MAFNVSTNDNKAFSVSAGFQNYTSLISSYNNIGIGKNIATTDQNWILNSPVSSAVYNCMAVTTDGMIQVACTKDKIYRYDNVWTQIYTTSTLGVSFSCVCLSDDGVCITASDLSTGIYVSTNSGTTFTIIHITNPKMVCMSKNGLYQTVINSGNIYTTTDKWATSNGLGVTSPTSLCMSYDGSRQIVFAFFPGRPPLVPDLRLLYLSTNYGSSFTTIPQPTLLNRIASCNCSSDGIIVTAVSNEIATSKVYVSTSPSILFNQVFSTSAQVPTVFSMSLSATGIQQWCVIGGNMYQSTDTGSTWTPVSNLPTQASFWAQACVSGDNSIVTIVGLDTVNTIGYIYYSKTSSSTVSSDKPLLYGLGQSIDYVISLDRMLGL